MAPLKNDKPPQPSIRASARLAAARGEVEVAEEAAGVEGAAAEAAAVPAAQEVLAGAQEDDAAHPGVPAPDITGSPIQPSASPLLAMELAHGGEVDPLLSGDDA